MAQTLERQENHENLTSDNSAPAASSPANKEATSKSNRPPRLSNIAATGKFAPQISPAQGTVSTGVEWLASSSASIPPTHSHQSFQPHRYQPSKVFVSKCRTELEALLESIKDSYHDNIKSLYSEEVYADLFVQIGEDFKKPLHKCVVASRAFKFYSTLKKFKLIEVPEEKDIIIREFQERNASVLEEEKTSSTVVEDPSSEKQPEATEEAISEIDCCLPDDLISPELLLSFVRRVYLDQDVTEEETKLNHRLIDWLKVNKPELIKTPTRQLHSPKHRESFRTIQPDFEALSLNKSPTMSLDQSKNQVEDIDNNVDDDTSQVVSLKEESLTGLTRTETFELLTKSNPDSPRVGTPSKNISVDTQPDDEKNDASQAQDYAPTTATGLRPKTFTTPVGVRTGKNSSLSSGTKSTKAAAAAPAPAATKQNSRDESTSTKSTANSSASKVALTKQSSSGSTATATSKRSSISSNISESTPDSQVSKTSVAKTKVATSSGAAIGKAKPMGITRAHPISMERSQSPGNAIKSSGRNFIVANKKLISQMEKKLPVQSTDQSVYDAEVELNDAISFPLEPLTTDNLASQIDQFTLVSYSKLAEALSRMFIGGILSDVIVLVKDGKQIKAHKCILAARSAYLADLITKQALPLATTETETKNQPLKIDLTEFSYPAVYFSIMHIYSGVVKVPDDLDLEELTKLTHLLHVDTLKQVCMHDLRMNYCHFFHKPCNVCCVGVLKTLPLAWRYDYTDLYSKCLHWIGAHFASIFCLKEFSELTPHDLLEECYSATLSQLTPENIIPKTIECQKLLKNLPRVKWTESIICLVGRQLEDFCHYVADNYEKILQSESFLNLGKTCWECEILEENLLAAMNHLKPDSGCKTLIQLHKIECSNESHSEDSRNVSDSFANLVSKMRKYCERYLLKEAAAVVHCSSWRHMNPSLQKRIKDQAIISTDFDEPTKQLASKPKLQSMSRAPANQSGSGQASSSSTESGVRSPNIRTTPDSRLKSPSTTYLPPPKNKAAAARHVKVLK